MWRVARISCATPPLWQESFYMLASVQWNSRPLVPGNSLLSRYQKDWAIPAPALSARMAFLEFRAHPLPAHENHQLLVIVCQDHSSWIRTCSRSNCVRPLFLRHIRQSTKDGMPAGSISHKAAEWLNLDQPVTTIVSIVALSDEDFESWLFSLTK